MPIRTIAVMLLDEAVDGPLLARALTLAERLGSHLEVTCLGIDATRHEAMPIAPLAEIALAGMTEAKSRAEALRDWAKARLGPDPSRISLQPVVAQSVGLEAAVARIGRYADLILAAPPHAEGQRLLAGTLVEAALFGTGVPVLIAPEAADLARPFRRIAIAWNESEEAMAAVRGSLPFLAEAEAVDILMVDPPPHSAERADPGGGLSLMLSRHGVRPEVAILARTMPRTTDVILRAARERGVDALVMGAYTHNRFLQSILGGMTREMLREVPLPLLMAR